VAAGQRPGAGIQAQLDDALVLLVVVAGERKGKTDASAVAVEVEHDLFNRRGSVVTKLTCSTSTLRSASQEFVR
jgi:hypothetical protein